MHKQRKKIKKPWPTKAAMKQVYAMKLWGGNHADFYSGEGSHLPEIVNPYIEAISSFLTSFETPLTVCDLGCGDFNIGSKLVDHTQKYIAIDIVDDLIERNKEKFKNERLEFHCLDIAVDDLPAADSVIIRQVLQHLSNAEIQQIIKKLTAYKYILLTEHLPEGDFIPNKDIISGQGIRLKQKSGLNLLAAPFHFKVAESKELLSIKLKNNKGIILTTLYKVF
ncbi:class I SAM-dependent methyltransferase [Oceanihabitans sediminis]|uniref:class I SAM-dependent methyltransferase n=1 Tax=Oceanihabitans sediminis TaxID=1812012 RepID=UPI00092FE66F|nr:class I SAM-dependent methyltransferase [Oceanihabitans sediminis]MDX1279170.1 class I SAM-dependent methyltransferase [Oceanihabitans sediminis]MDX1774540.1 class I SAM-dependent methyltransferase [Oceanihabitans sediminis]